MSIEGSEIFGETTLILAIFQLDFIFFEDSVLGHSF